LQGGDGFDQLDGGAGDDTLLGDEGDDYLFGGAGHDWLFGGAGGDFILGEDGNDVVLGEDGDDWLYAGASNDHVVGEAGNDVVHGEDGDDAVYGGTGTDTLSGGTGQDVLTGGWDADVFAFDAALGAANADRIADFEVGTDKIQLSGTIFTGLAPGGLAASAFTLGSVATTAQQRLVYNKSTGELFWDADGSGGQAMVKFAAVTAGLSLSASDFLVV
ncbi:calcium-binding protein, partial [Microvirga sp. CF3016]|uniref:calcium-binding protein n=1 Tax=Microvirga sp. CF3016 TaxID=3110181 RepID=UPI002E75EF99